MMPYVMAKNLARPVEVTGAGKCVWLGSTYWDSCWATIPVLPCPPQAR